jgi:AmmeMemoRadiSam system protein B
VNLRKQSLPPGWYPQSAEQINGFLGSLLRDNPSAVCAAAPHAGWYYSGLIAARAVSSLREDAETVVVVGGHLPGGARPLIMTEDGAVTPLGILETDGEFCSRLSAELGCRGDQYRDNTVEVLLPMVKFFFPRSRVAAMRFPADLESFERGKTIARIGAALGRRLVLLGSTDLTHYGDNYGFAPAGSGKKALDWVTNVNDAAFIAAALSGNPAETLARAEEDFSACSAGAVLACQGFAAERGAAASGGLAGANRAELLIYATSADVTLAEGRDVPDSFVGYAAMRWG